MGYRRAEQTDAPAATLKTNAANEPHPVEIYGESKPISDTKIGRYLTDDTFYYINLYNKIKKYGLPHIYKSWMDAPDWLMEMCDLFERADSEYEAYQANKQYGN